MFRRLHKHIFISARCLPTFLTLRVAITTISPPSSLGILHSEIFFFLTKIHYYLVWAHQLNLLKHSTNEAKTGDMNVCISNHIATMGLPPKNFFIHWIHSFKNIYWLSTMCQTVLDTRDKTVRQQQSKQTNKTQWEVPALVVLTVRCKGQQ